MWQYNHSDYLTHYGVLGMKWGVRRYQNKDGTLTPRGKKRYESLENIKTDLLEKSRAKVYSGAAKLNPREHVYTVKRNLTRHTSSDTEITKLVNNQSKISGVLTSDSKLISAVDREGIKQHKNAVYDNLTKSDLDNMKKYTDAAVYSRSINSYLATGEPPHVSGQAKQLKESISKNRINNQTVYRSTNLKFSTEGIRKKLDQYGEQELAKTFDAFDKNFKGKSFLENRLYSTSTSPSFAIDTWRKVNPTAAKTYNSYLVIDCKNTPGIMADGRTSKGKKLVNTRSNQEAILAPTKMTYRKLAWDSERQMFVIHLDAE